MQQYIVIGKPLFLSSGILELTEKQYQARTYCLEPAKKKGQYKIVKEACFKIGEKIGLDKKVNKAMALNLELVEPLRATP